uniref:NmrA-like domain-containing protein n=1 Tax=Aegilops tauschii subsp. strangulata TaxID=200361 RepID=A0A453MQ66_AEGTS
AAHLKLVERSIFGSGIMVLDKERSRVLVIGGTGHIGKHIVAASARRGHSTSVLIRDVAPSDPAKMQLLKSFIDSGVALIKGDLFDHGSLVNAIKGVDVVVSAVGPRQLVEQSRIVMAIKEAGNVKRFLPSEFGSDVERVHTVDPAATLYAGKLSLRRLIEAEGIPHTYVCCNGFAETYLPSIGDVTAVGAGPPSDKITVLGDGDAKGKHAHPISCHCKFAPSSINGGIMC